MDINEYKEKVVSVTKEFATVTKKPVHDKQTSFYHLTEEVGEVGELLRQEIMNPKKFSTDNLSEELADVVLFAVLIANEYDLDMSQALEKNIEKIELRIKKIRNEF